MLIKHFVSMRKPICISLYAYKRIYLFIASAYIMALRLEICHNFISLPVVSSDISILRPCDRCLTEVATIHINLRQRKRVDAITVE